MPFYTDHIYPHLVDALGDPPPIRAIRRQIIPLARGKVLEIGAGSGANFIHYDPSRVSMLYALEPNPGMIRHPHIRPVGMAQPYGVEQALAASGRGERAGVGDVVRQVIGGSL